MFNSELDNYTNSKAVITDTGIELTYGQLIVESDLLAGNIKERSLIFSFCENTIGALIGYYAFINASHVQLMIDASLDFFQVKKLISLYKPNFLWMPNSLLEHYSQEIVVYSNWNYSLLRVSEMKVLMHEDLSLLLATSGSTGSPKLVRLSSKNLLSNAYSIAKYLKLSNSERPITSLPMNYSYGLSVINSHLIAGATILLTNHSIVQKEFWGFAKKEKATSISGVPYTYQMLKMLRFSSMDLPDLKTLTQAGGKLSSNLVKEFSSYALNKNKEFIVMYGQTEATARMSFLPFNISFEKSESIGVPIPGGDFYLKDLNSEIQITEDYVQGELVYQGPNVSLGYANEIADLARGDENHGTLCTGDIAYRDKDGCYFITGRKKRFLKIYGNRINLDEVEQILLSENLECACDGVDDKMIVYTTLENASPVIIDLLVSKLKLNHRAFEIRIISEIPKNPSGKVLYAKLKES